MVKITIYSIDETRRDVWEYYSNVLLLKSIYQNDFREDNGKLINKEKEIRLLIRDEKAKFDFNNLKLFCKNEWKELIIKAINEIRNEINQRKTKGMAFSDILRQSDKIEEDLVDIDNIELNEFENIYFSDVKPLRQDTKERIEIENYNNQQKTKNILYAIIIAAISLIIGHAL